ncbi:hypothetical protein [Emticicia sp. 17c]|uniref:hypothetical protein n=1 Tax=Emticicia sp. 17c TaxID=3127704 RepID=UPI00301BB8E7
MSQSSTSIKEIADNIGKVLQQVTITDAANDKIGGVSITSKHKTLIAALFVSLRNDENPITEPLILRKILEAIANGALVPANAQPVFNSLPYTTNLSQSIDFSKYVLKSDYDELRAAYDAIYDDAGSDKIVILSQEEYDGLGITDEQIVQFVDIAQEYEREEAIAIINQILNAEDDENDDTPSGY